MLYRITSLFFFIMLHNMIWGQNLSNFKNQKPLDFGGRVNLGLSFYETTRDKPQFSPLSYSINARPTLSIYGVSIPITLIYSEKQRSYRQPFNKFGLSPQYKWAKLHIGQRNINFNPYTLSGKTFLGFGTELTPGNLRLGFIKGRFNKEVKNVEGIESFVQPTFERNGWAGLMGFGNNKNHFDISFLKAKDIAPTNLLSEDFGKLSPAENLVIGLQGTISFLKYFNVSVNVAGSAYTEDQSSIEIGSEEIDKILPREIFTPRLNSTLKFAGDAGIRYSNKNFSLSGGYKRIDPDYRSMGTYRFLTDIEDYTLSPAFSFLKRKLRVSGTYGIQRNNISGLKLQTSNRTIGSVNINYNSKSNFSSSATYSNFRSDVISVNDEVLSDSFDIIQVSENINLRFRIPLGKLNKNSISLSGGQQKFTREIEIENLDSDNVSQNINVNYNHRPSQLGLGYTVGLNGVLIDGFRPQERYGIRLGLNKRIDKNMRTSINGGIFKSFINGDNNGLSLNSSIRFSYKIDAKQSVNLSARFIDRNSPINTKRNYSDFRSQINYSVRF